MALTPLCREYQVDWLFEKLQDSLKEPNEAFEDLETLLKCILFAEEMNFDQSIKAILINEVSDDFLSFHMSSDFMSLSKNTQVLIARKRLWLLLRKIEKENRTMILNEKDCGLLFIFEDQSVFKFKLNDLEKGYIE